ncbi:hypothetical protein [Nonomuraea sp. NPDC050310]|uniref:RNA polymerase sigma factor n=1 Tax=Nonomuraea sp. NPDC050310 TaxID=3154935 RepID=UPI0033E0D2D6
MWDALSPRDRGEIGLIADRYGPGLLDYLSAELSREDALRALACVLLSARTHLHRLSGPATRGWLYALARAHRADLAHAHPASTGSWRRAAGDSAPDLVDGALAALETDLREVLDLSARHGLTDAEIGAIFDLGVLEVERLVAEAERRLGQWVAAAAGAQGEDGCRQLALRLADWQAAPMRRTRTQITRHIEDCRRCAATRGEVGAAELLAHLPLLDYVGPLEDLLAVAEPLPGHDAGWRADGYPVQQHTLMEALDRIPPPAGPIFTGDEDPSAEPSSLGEHFLANYSTPESRYRELEMDMDLDEHTDGDHWRDLGRTLLTKGKAVLVVAVVAVIGFFVFRGVQAPAVRSTAAAGPGAGQVEPALVNTPAAVPDRTAADGGQDPAAETGVQQPPPVPTVAPHTVPTAAPVATVPVVNNGQQQPSPSAPPPTRPADTTGNTDKTGKADKNDKSAGGAGPDAPPQTLQGPGSGQQQKGGPKTPPAGGGDSQQQQKSQPKAPLPKPPAPVASIAGMDMGTSRHGSLQVSCPKASCQVVSSSVASGPLSASGASFSISEPSTEKGCEAGPRRGSGSITVSWTGTATGDGVTTEGTTTAEGTLTVSITWSVEIDRGRATTINGVTYWSNCGTPAPEAGGSGYQLGTRG